MNNKGLINIILVLVIMKLALLIVLVLFNQMFTYKKIFANEVNFYKQQLIIDNQEKLNNISNFAFSNPSNKVGFLPDDASFLCQNGLEIYKLSQNGACLYFGNRIFKEYKDRTELLLKKERYYRELFANSKKINIEKLQFIDFNGNGTLDQIYLTDDTKQLWYYNITTDQLFLLDSKNCCEDYIVGRYTFIFDPASLKNNYSDRLVIFLHSKQYDRDYIDIFYFDLKSLSKHQLIRLTFKERLAKFRLYHDYMVLLYQDSKLAPSIHKISVKSNYSIEVKKSNIQIYSESEEISSCKENPEVNLSEFTIIWNQKLRTHQVIITKSNCVLTKYNFKLPTDQNILSFRTIDY